MNLIIYYRNATILKYLSTYPQAFKLLNRYEFQDTNKICIQVTRRYCYCCTKLLAKYIRKYTTKSHKVTPILHRAFEIARVWGDQLYKEETHVAVRSPKRLNSISPMSFGRSRQVEITIKNDKWLIRQKELYLQSMVTILKYLYLHTKLRKETIATLVLQKYLMLSCFMDQHFQLNQHTIRCRQVVLILIGNAYLEINQPAESIEYYDICMKMGLERIIMKQLHSKEMGTVTIQQLKFTQSLFKTSLLIILAIDTMSTAIEQGCQYEQVLQCQAFADHLCSILVYIRRGSDFVSYIYARHEYLYKRYFQHLFEQFELVKLTKLIVGQTTVDNLQYYTKQTFYQQLYDGFKHPDTNIHKFIAINDSKDQLGIQLYNQTNNHKKAYSESNGLDSTIVSGRHSKTNSEIQIQVEKNGLSSISLHQPIELIQQKLFPKPLIPMRRKYQKSQYIASIQPQPQQQSIPIPEYPNHSPKPTAQLDSEIHKIINKRLPPNYQSYENSHRQCYQLIQTENQLKRELPRTQDMLKFKEEFGNGQAVLKEFEENFNIHFEFNIMKYFDYLTSNQTLALVKLEEKESFKRLRLAEQKLLQSKQLVPKLNIEDPESQDKKEKEHLLNQVGLENAANKLLSSIQQRKMTGLEKVIKRKDVDNNQMYSIQKEQMKNAYEKKLIMTSLDDPKLKAQFAKNKQKQMKLQYEQMLEQRQHDNQTVVFKQTQDGIKSYLAENELYREKQKINESAEITLPTKWNKTQLAGSVKHLSARTYASLLKFKALNMIKSRSKQ